jgi:uncharacterized RDD family membrane protein YckC
VRNPWQTIGKKLARTRIVSYQDGRNLGFVGNVLLRSLLPFLIASIIGGCFTLIDILLIFGAERRCLHDLIAGTTVVEA